MTTSRVRVTEIFHSIQGESTHAGRPCVFIRLTGCPLRCTWCDTEYAFHGGVDMTIDEVVARTQAYGCGLVEITGGEPLHQAAAFPLIERLCGEGFEVLIETSGAIDIAPVDRRARVIMDIKCPGSMMADRTLWSNLSHLSHHDEAKFVVKDRADYEWAREFVRRENLTARCHVLFSPVFGDLDPRILAEWLLEDRLPVRFQLQLHKIIWSPDMRGV